MAEGTSKIPGGGSKGGTRFPRLNLSKSYEYCKKLVSKTHGGPQPKTNILSGVFNNSGSDGLVRVSALKQYGLLEESEGNISATELAKEIALATDQELASVLQKAFFTPKLFKDLFDTYLDDTVTIAKIKQGAGRLGVHLDSLEKCASIFIESAVLCKLAFQDGENITLTKSPQDRPDEESDETELTDIKENQNDELDLGGNVEDEELYVGSEKIRNRNSNVQVSIDLDSTMDTEKLEKQLKLLKLYGVI
jgi:hypothetical protein